MVDMTDIYFDVNMLVLQNILQIRIFKKGYTNNIKYNSTYITHSILDNREEFGIIELTKVNNRHIMDSSLYGESVKKYAEIQIAKIDAPMLGKGYGKVLYEKALDEALTLGLDGFASEDGMRSKEAERMYKNCRSIEYAATTFTIYEKRKWITLKPFVP